MGDVRGGKREGEGIHLKMERNDLPNDDILAPSQASLLAEQERGIGTTLLGSTPLSVGTLCPFESFWNSWVGKPHDDVI